MRVFVTGATGVIGSRAIQRLVEAEHHVTGVARTDEKAAFLKRFGVNPVRVSLFDAAALKEVIGGHDAVVNLATNIPSPNQAPDPQAWIVNDRLRNEASVKIVDAAMESGCEIFVQESITIPYAEGGESWIDESARVVRPSELASSGVAEDQARRFTKMGGRGIVLRFAMFYSHDGSHTPTIQAAIRAGQSPFIGKPESFLSMVHVEDAATAVLSALEAPADVYNIADDEPMRRRDLANAIASIEGVAPPALSVAIEGEVSERIEALMRSQRISNKRFKDTTGWSPKYRSVLQGWREVIAAQQEKL